MERNFLTTTASIAVVKEDPIPHAIPFGVVFIRPRSEVIPIRKPEMTMPTPTRPIRGKADRVLPRKRADRMRVKGSKRPRAI